ncbi:MAG: NifB/NifX family molybdenum-iron cluster-binding protein [Candidatus Micrarchaeia archaeon]
MTDIIIAAMVDTSDVLTGIGRAPRIIIAKVQYNNVTNIEEIDVKWDETHEKEQEGLHHSNIAKFLKAYGITDLVASGAGPDMQRMIEKLGIKLHMATGNYRSAIEAVAAQSRS